MLPFAVPDEWLILVAITPTLAALWTQWLVARNLRVGTIASSWPQAVQGIVLALGLALLAFAIVPALILTNGAATSLHWSAVLMGSAAWWQNSLNLLGGPLTEEFGWRGFGLPRLQVRYGPLPGSLLLGLLWVAWHAPLFLIRGWLSVPIWAFALLLVSLSVLMTWVVNRAQGSVLPSIMAHAVFNSSFPILVGLCRNLPTRQPGLSWYVVGVVLTTVLVAAATRGRLGYRNSITASAPA